MPFFPEVPASAFPANMRRHGPSHGPGRSAYPASMRDAWPPPSTPDRTTVSPDPAEEEARREIRRRTGSQWPDRPHFLLPAEQQHAATYNTGMGVFYSRFDEALRDNWTNALAMRKSVIIDELLLHRQMAVVGLSWHVEVDDPKDPDQDRVAERVTKLVEAIPNFQDMKRYLSEDKWYGKYGSQVTWGRVRIDGRWWVTVTAHQPVGGDSIVFRFDGTPGVLVRTGWRPRSAADQEYVRDLKVEQIPTPWIGQTDRARALFLGDQFWRDHFVISKFLPTASDYMFEGDKAALVHGRGFRDILYWDYQFREDLRSWAAE